MNYQRLRQLVSCISNEKLRYKFFEAIVGLYFKLRDDQVLYIIGGLVFQIKRYHAFLAQSFLVAVVEVIHDILTGIEMTASRSLGFENELGSILYFTNRSSGLETSTAADFSVQSFIYELKEATVVDARALRLLQNQEFVAKLELSDKDVLIPRLSRYCAFLLEKIQAQEAQIDNLWLEVDK